MTQAGRTGGACEQPERRSGGHRRIRDRQLRARDPLAAQRKSQRLAAARYKRPKVSFREVMREIPGKSRGMIIGGLFGFLLALVLDRVLHLKLPKIRTYWAGYV